MSRVEKITGLLLLFFTLLGLLLIFVSRGPTLSSPDGKISIEVVKTEETRRLGLSGRDSIGPDNGMLFEFDEESIAHCFWMKDMNFAIDMVWLNSQKKVVHIEENVLPETYPESFCPDEPAQYVLEVKAGRSSQLGINQDGVEVQF